MGILKEILHELVLIRKELQAIRSNLEFRPEITVDGEKLAKAVRKSIRKAVRTTAYTGREVE